jgi:hypothetical protein
VVVGQHRERDGVCMHCVRIVTVHTHHARALKQDARRNDTPCTECVQLGQPPSPSAAFEVPARRRPVSPDGGWRRRPRACTLQKTNLPSPLQFGIRHQPPRRQAPPARAFSPSNRKKRMRE